MRKNHLSGNMKRILAIACAAMVAVTSVPANSVAYASEAVQMQEEETQEADTGAVVENENDDAGVQAAEETDGNTDEDIAADTAEESEAEAADEAVVEESGADAVEETEKEDDKESKAVNSEAAKAEDNKGTDAKPAKAAKTKAPQKDAESEITSDAKADASKEAKAEGEDADKTSPKVIQVEKLGNKTVQITIEEENPSDAGWKWSYDYKNSEGETNKVSDTVTEDPDADHKIVIKITPEDEGIATNFTIEGKDASDNDLTFGEGMEDKLNGMVIDTIAPVVTEVVKSEDGMSISVKIDEDYFGDGLKCSYKKEGEEDRIEETINKNEFVIKPEDGKYSDFRISGTDKYGNAVEISEDLNNTLQGITLDVDRTAPKVTEVTQSEDKKSISIKIEEDNVSEDGWTYSYQKKGEENRTEGNSKANEFTITPGAGVFTDFTVSGKDAYGNSLSFADGLEAKLKAMIIDTVDPVVTSVDLSADKKKITIKIDEDHTAEACWKYSYAQEGKEERIEKTATGNSVVIAPEGDGDYSDFRIEGADAYGNPLQIEEALRAKLKGMTIIIDTADPIVNITNVIVDGSQKDVGNIAFGQHKIVYQFEVTDEHLAWVKYYVSSTELTEEPASFDGWKDVTIPAGQEGEAVKSVEFEVSADSKGYVYVFAKDSENGKKLKDFKALVVEGTAPLIDAEVEKTEDEIPINPTITIKSVTDDKTEDGEAVAAYSGIQEIYYTVDGKEGSKQSLYKSNSTSLEDLVGIVDLSNIPEAGAGGTIEFDDLEGIHTIEIFAVDWCGNSKSVKFEGLRFDHNAPTIEITPVDFVDYPASAPEIKVTDKDGSIDLVINDEKGDNETNEHTGTYSVALNGNPAVSDKEYTAGQKVNTTLADLGIATDGTMDGTYTIEVTAKDEAGNPVSEAASFKFDVDTTSPVVTAKVEKLPTQHNNKGEIVYNSDEMPAEGVVITFRVEDEHPVPIDEIEFSCNEDRAVRKDTDDSSFAVTMKNDGHYNTFAVTGADAVGNSLVTELAEITIDDMTVDTLDALKIFICQTPPIVELTNYDSSIKKFEDRNVTSHLLNGTLELTIEDWKENTVDYVVKVDGEERINEKEKPFTGSDEDELGMFTTTFDLAALGITEEEEPREYLISVEATDNVGNTAGIDDDDKIEFVLFVDDKSPEVNGEITDAPASTIADTGEYVYNIETMPEEGLKIDFTIDEDLPKNTGWTYAYDFTTSQGVKAETVSEDISIDEGSGEFTIELTEDGYYSNFVISGSDFVQNEVVKDNISVTIGEDTVKLTDLKLFIDTVSPVLEGINSTMTAKTDYVVDPGFKNYEDDKYYYVSATKVVDKYIVTETNPGAYTVVYQEKGNSITKDFKVDEFELTFTGDGKYESFELTGKDRAGNPLIVSKEFKSVPEKVNSVTDNDGTISLEYGKVLDTERPVVSFTAKPRSDENSLEIDSNGAERRYYKGSFWARFNVTDENTIVASNIITELRKANEKGGAKEENYNEHDYKDFAVQEGVKFIVSGDKTNEISFKNDVKEEGNYRFFISGTDKAGNKIEPNGSIDYTDEMGLWIATANAANEERDYLRSNDKVFDKTAPQATLSVLNGKKAFYTLEMTPSNYNLKAYEPYQRKINSTVSLVTTDKSPVMFTYDIYSTSDKTKNVSADYENDVQMDVGIPAKEQTITIRNLVIRDRAGNLLTLTGDPKNKGKADAAKKTLWASNQLIYDNTKPTTKPKDIVAPVATIKATGSITHRNADGRDLFNGPRTLSVTITDPGAGDYSSGLNKVSYDVYVDGNRVAGDSQTYGVKGASQALNKDTANIDNGTLTYVRKFTIELKGSYQTNNIEVRVNADDHSGNKMETVLYRCGIDSVGPKITVDYDNNSAQNEKYFKADRTATITVVDRNIDNGKIHINTQVSVPGSFAWSSGGGNGANDTWTKKLYYNTDGDYTLDLPGCTDALGNPATVDYRGTAPKAFTIDKTIPVIYVTFDNNSAQNEIYYKDPRTATVRIHEHNFRESDVKVDQTLDGRSRSGFGGSGDDHSATIDFNQDGNYAFNVEYTDLAGNPAEKVTVNKFVIDMTKPVVKFIVPSKNDSIFQGDIAPQIEYSDTNIDRGHATINLKGMKKSNALEVAEDSFDGTKGVVRFENLKKVRENDDIYTATAIVTDFAGNEETATITFSVNRFGSTYDYNGDEGTGKLVEGYYTNAEGDVILREVNVNPLTEKKLTLYKDGDNRVLVEGTDYKVEEKQVNGHYEYIYTIYAKNFEEEGNYNIIATSKDKAGNTNSNSSVKGEEGGNEVPLRFAVDKTEPKFEVTGADLSKDKFRESQITLDIRPLDNMNAVAKVRIRVLDKNGNLLQPEFELEGKELAEFLEQNDGKYTLTVDQNTGKQTIEMIVTDAAGNEYKESYEVLVTPNLFYQYINTPPAIAGTIAGVGGLLFFLIWKRKKDQDEENAA